MISAPAPRGLRAMSTDGGRDVAKDVLVRVNAVMFKWDQMLAFSWKRLRFWSLDTVFNWALFSTNAEVRKRGPTASLNPALNGHHGVLPRIQVREPSRAREGLSPQTNAKGSCETARAHIPAKARASAHPL